jgi:hypothetical protein
MTFPMKIQTLHNVQLFPTPPQEGIIDGINRRLRDRAACFRGGVKNVHQRSD